MSAQSSRCLCVWALMAVAATWVSLWFRPTLNLLFCHHRARPSQGPRLYHSATNRIRDQQRIERENLAILKRLQQTRASNALRRDTLLQDYEQKTGKAVDTTRPVRQRNVRGNRYTVQVQHRGKPAWQDSW